MVTAWSATLELSTRHGYQGLIELKVRPVLGDVPLRRLTVDLLDRFYVELRQHDHRCQRCARLVREGKPPLRAGPTCSMRSQAATRRCCRMR